MRVHHYRRLDTYSQTIMVTKNIEAQEQLDHIFELIKFVGPKTYYFTFAVADEYPEEEQYGTILKYLNISPQSFDRFYWQCFNSISDNIFYFLREKKYEQRLIVLHIVMKQQEKCSSAAKLIIPFFAIILNMEKRGVLHFQSNVCYDDLGGDAVWQALVKQAEVDEVKVKEMIAYFTEIPEQTEPTNGEPES